MKLDVVNYSYLISTWNNWHIKTAISLFLPPLIFFNKAFVKKNQKQVGDPLRLRRWGPQPSFPPCAAAPALSRAQGLYVGGRKGGWLVNIKNKVNPEIQWGSSGLLPGR